jgi:hypothetical protein
MPCRLGNQSIGMQQGMGLNDGAARMRSLLADVTAAVAAAGGTASRREVFARFADRASRASVYRCIDAAVESTGATLAPTKLPPRLPGMTIAEQDAELTEVMPEVAVIEALAGGYQAVSEPSAPVADVEHPSSPAMPEAATQADESEYHHLEPPPRAVEQARQPRDLMVNADGEVTVDLSAGMVRALGRAEKLMEKAEHEDGEIRNARLMVVAIDLYGKTAERKARVDADLSDSSQQGAYLRAITNAVLAEPADVKARILARMRGVNAQWGM